MAGKNWMLVVGLLMVAALGAACTVAGAQAANTPEAVVESFYGWMLENTGYDVEADVMRNPVVEGTYAGQPEIAPEMVAFVEETVAGFEGGGYDPILCAQDVPQSVEVGTAEIDGDTAFVPVSTSFEGHSFTVKLGKAGDDWKIEQVICDFGS